MTFEIRRDKQGRIRAEIVTQNGETLSGASDTFAGALRNLAAAAAEGTTEATLLIELVKSGKG